MPPEPADQLAAKLGPVLQTALAGREGAAGTLADSFDAAAKQIESGGKRADVWAGVQSSWRTARMAAFERLATPAFGSLLAEDSEFTPESRPVVAAAFRAFATGLRGVK